MIVNTTFDELYAAHFDPNVRHVKLRFGVTLEEAEDIVQVCLIQLWHEYPTFESLASPVGFLRSRVDFLARTFISRRHHSLSLDTSLYPGTNATRHEYCDLTPSAPSVEDLALSHIELEQVAQQIQTWPVLEQLVLRMNVAGFSRAEIHQHLVAKYGFRGTLKSVCHTLERARQHLHKEHQTHKAERNGARFRRKATWSSRYAACVECGTTEHRYGAKGLCISCYGKQQRQEIKQQRYTPIAHTVQQWSRKHVACISCGTTKTSHQARGYCEQCYRTQIRYPQSGGTVMRSKRKWVVTLIK